MTASHRPHGSPPLDEPLNPPSAAGPPPEPDRPGPRLADAPGLGEQIGATRESARRLVTAHVDLAKAELGDIADAAKQAAILAGIAIAMGIFVGLLVGVGLPLFLGEWIFGSIGWGILLGVLLLGAIAVVAVVTALGPGVNGQVGPSFVVAAIVGVVAGVLFGLDATNRGWSLLADSVAGNLAADSRPLV